MNERSRITKENNNGERQERREVYNTNNNIGLEFGWDKGKEGKYLLEAEQRLGRGLDEKRRGERDNGETKALNAWGPMT